jgi:thymidylate synthase (FAD)
MQVVLTNITPDAEVHCEKAARDCYDSIGKMKDPTQASNLIKACTVADHLTVNGHAMATFRITGVSRALMGQITRHRTACFSIRSQRYVDEEGFEYVTPPTIKNNKAADVLYQKGMADLARLYDSLKMCGVPKEDARMVLPNSCYTTINMSMSFEGWLHYLRRRLDKKAQWEIRELAIEQYKALNKACPRIFNKETLLAKPKYNIDESLL